MRRDPPDFPALLTDEGERSRQGVGVFMVRMVDLVKGGGDKEPDPKKNRKSASLKGGEKSSGSPEEERPAEIGSPEPECQWAPKQMPFFESATPSF